MGRLFGARRTSPTLLQQLHVITCLGLIGPALYLGVRDLSPIDDALAHTIIVLRNSEVAQLPWRLWRMVRIPSRCSHSLPGVRKLAWLLIAERVPSNGGRG